MAGVWDKDRTGQCAHPQANENTNDLIRDAFPNGTDYSTIPTCDNGRGRAPAQSRVQIIARISNAQRGLSHTSQMWLRDLLRAN